MASGDIFRYVFTKLSQTYHPAIIFFLCLQRINMSSKDWLVLGPWEAKYATVDFMGSEALSSDCPRHHIPQNTDQNLFIKYNCIFWEAWRTWLSMQQNFSSYRIMKFLSHCRTHNKMKSPK